MKSDDVANKTVLVRLDLNIPINEKGNIIDNSRIIKTLETLKFLISNNSKVVILSHFGRVKCDSDKEKYSLKIVAQELSNLLCKNVFFVPFGVDNIKNFIDEKNFGEVIMLENTRFYDLDDNKESNCDLELSKFLASFADVFVNDAFGVSHRKHASTYGVRKFLPSYYGFLIENEIYNLNDLISVNKKPFVVFMGGAKVEDKLPIIKKLLCKCDYLLLGGGILNSFLKARGVDIKNSLCSCDDKIISELLELLNLHKEKIIMSEDFIWSNDSIMDISVDKYINYLKNASLIFVNGTPGKFEEKNFFSGTNKLFSILDNVNGDVIIGGGDTASFVSKYKNSNNYKFISSGGGASLEYVANDSLAALEDL